MYSTSATSQTTSDPKYTVADILSSMANGEAVNFSEPGPSSSYSASITTPILTPTTLASIEQTFINLQAASTTTGLISSVSSQQDVVLNRQSGFVPPIVDPNSGMVHTVVGDYASYSDESSVDDPDWYPTGAKQMRIGDLRAPGPYSSPQPHVVTGTPARRLPGPRSRAYRDEKLTPDEEQRRHVRRERNKQAAAKCRQRRVDQTNLLQNQTEDLEEEKTNLENEIESLQQVKEHLEFVLEAHTPMCDSKKLRSSNTSNLLKVKQDPETNSAAATSFTLPMPRPSTLSLSLTTSSTLHTPTLTTVTEATGISITTPSGGLYSNGLSLDSILDGHTGLTPLTGAPSCGTEMHRSSSDSNSPKEGITSSSRLMAL